jgi:hypothetical protein
VAAIMAHSRALAGWHRERHERSCRTRWLPVVAIVKLHGHVPGAVLRRVIPTFFPPDLVFNPTALDEYDEPPVGGPGDEADEENAWR